VTYECEPAGMAPGSLFDIVRVQEDPPLHYSLLVGTRDPVLCDMLPSPSRLLAPLNNTCIEHVDGWWTYELCLGNKLRQYHPEGTKAVQDSTIGQYDWRAGEQLGPAKVGAPPAIVQQYIGGTPCDVRKGMPRTATVRFECMPPATTDGTGASSSSSSSKGYASHALSLLSIKENPTCEYTITFGTPLVCEHPEVSPGQMRVVQPPPTPVYCVPAE
jgi:hypothetical protein